MNKLTYPFKEKALLILVLLCPLCVAFLILNSVLFIDAAFLKLPQADDYRLTFIHLMPWFEDRWVFSSLWSDIHPNPIHAIVLIGSAEFENLSFDSLPYFIIFFMLLKWVGYYFSLTIFSENTVNQRVVLLFGIALIVFSFNSTMQYRWNSVGIAQIYHAIGAAYLITLAVFLNSPDRTKNICFLFIIAFFFQLISKQYAAVWLTATFVVVAIYFAVQKGKDDKRLLKFSVVFILVLVLEALFHELLGTKLSNHDEGLGLISFYESWGHRPIELIKYLLVSISSPIINPRLLLLNFNLTEGQIIFLCVNVAILYLISILCCIKNLRYVQYQIALIMIVFTLITIFAGLVYRTTAETQWMQAHVSRYVSFRDISAIAVLWVIINQSFRFKRFEFLGIVLSILVIMQIHYARYNWNYLSGLKSYESTLRQQLVYVGDYLDIQPDASPYEIIEGYETKYKREFSINLGKNSHQVRIIKFWKKNKFNLYNE